MRKVRIPRLFSTELNEITPLASEFTAGPTFCHFPLTNLCSTADFPATCGRSCAFIVKAEVLATELMLKVHNEGRAQVSSGTREEMERDVQRLHEYGLWATLQRDNEY